MDALIVPGTLNSLEPIRDYVKAAAALSGLDKRREYRLELAVDEVATNIINYGYQRAGKTGDVEVRVEILPEQLTVILEDDSAPFDPMGLKRPEQIDQPISERPIGGLGIFLALESVDEFRYEYVDGHNRNILIMKRTAA